jgi:hypothetical protein|tara:strand:- start:437 stop:709 length:273 start_codon:yes stop_codon:yes gene_type:complete
LHVIKPHRAFGCTLLLWVASKRQQKAQINRQGGKRLMLVEQTDDFVGPYSLIRNATVDLPKLLRPDTNKKTVKFKDILGTLCILTNPLGN